MIIIDRLNKSIKKKISAITTTILLLVLLLKGKKNLDFFMQEYINPLINRNNQKGEKRSCGLEEFEEKKDYIYMFMCIIEHSINMHT